MSGKLKLLSVFLLLNLLAACGHKADLTVDQLAGTFWILTEMPGELPAGVEINLQFDVNRISGKGVCNRYFSEYSLGKGNTVSFTAIAATEMMCMEHSQVELQYFQTLEKAETIDLADEKLTIKTPEADLVYAKAPAPAES